MAYADSTIISNFMIFFGDCCNFVIGAVEYLNRGSIFENGNQIMFLLRLILTCLALYL